MRGIYEGPETLRTNPKLYLAEIPPISPPFQLLIIIENVSLILTNDESMIN
jgi:hypothetical protein